MNCVSLRKDVHSNLPKLHDPKTTESGWTYWQKDAHYDFSRRQFVDSKALEIDGHDHQSSWKINAPEDVAGDQGVKCVRGLGGYQLRYHRQR